MYLRAMQLSPERVKAARENAGLSQRAVAVAAGVSIDTVRRAENGLHAPSANAIGRIAYALDVLVDSFFVHGDESTTADRACALPGSELDQAPTPDPSGDSRVDGIKAGAR